MIQLNRFRVLAISVIVLGGCMQQDKKTDLAPHERMDGMDQAMLQEFKMTRDPQLNMVPKERLASARTYMETLLSSANRTAALAWEERGPNNIGGRTRTILVDKRDVSGNSVFAASVSGGLFKTTNFLTSPPTWTIVNDFLPNLAITCMVQDDVNQSIMYAGTGEGWFNIDAVRGRGIYKSLDGGITWNVLPSTIQVPPAVPDDSTFEFVQDLVIANGVLFASLRNQTGLARGVKRSADGGLTWTQVLGAPIVGFATGRAADLEVASNGDVYATLGIFGTGSVWKSSFATHGSNTGALGNWVEITPVFTLTRQRLEISIAPSDPQRIYLFGQDAASSQVIGVFRSFNGGASWDSVGSPTGINGGAPQTWYNLISAVDPNNPDIVWAGGLNQAKSIDGGANWTTISGGVHVDHHFQHFISSSKMVNGNDGGIYYTDNADAGTPTWVNKNTGYNVTQYYAADLHPTLPNFFLAGSQDNGTHRFQIPGMNTVSSAVGGDGGFCNIDQTDGQLQMAATVYNNHYRSLNGGASFTFQGGVSNSRGQFINPSDLDDVGNNLYSGDNAGQYYCIRGLDATPSAIAVTVPGMSPRQLTTVKVDPFSANTIWVGASFSAVPMVLKISDANTTTPTILASATIPVASGAAISSIDVDPANANHILVTLSNYGVVSVFESINGGTSYTSIEGNLPDMPVRWGIFAPPNAQLNGPTGGNGGVLLGTELGVWSTSAITGGTTVWIPNNAGQANVSTHMLKFRASDNTVLAATHGRGLFTTIIPTVVTGVPNLPVTKDFIKYAFQDNSQLHIVKGTLQTRTMTMQLVDMNGRIVHSSKGQYQNTSIDLGTLQRGSYIIRIRGNNNEYFVKQFIL